MKVNECHWISCILFTVIFLVSSSSFGCFNQDTAGNNCLYHPCVFCCISDYRDAVVPCRWWNSLL